MKDNKLIAEFMGMNYGDPNDNSVMIQMTPQGNEVVPIDSMKYHTSWDWLMPVVEKCLTTDEKTDGHHYFINNALLTIDALLTFNIEVVYDRVVEFIKDCEKKT